MSFENIYYKGKKMKRDIDVEVANINPNIVWFINPKTMYTLQTKKPKKVVDKKTK